MASAERAMPHALQTGSGLLVPDVTDAESGNVSLRAARNKAS